MTGISLDDKEATTVEAEKVASAMLDVVNGAKKRGNGRRRKSVLLGINSDEVGDQDQVRAEEQNFKRHGKNRRSKRRQKKDSIS